VRTRGPLWATMVVSALVLPSAAGAAPPSVSPAATLLATGLEGASGSTVGPGGALYVTEGAAGRISRIDPRTGEVTTFAEGLPTSIVGIGGAIDLVFVGKTAYVLVTLVGPDVGGSDVVGVYRVDGPDSFTVIADLGAFSIDNPTDAEVFVPTGVQYAIENYRGGFLVTDGHYNRLLQVSLDGQVTELIAFANIVPTGLEVHGSTIYMAEAGPVPHLPQDGRVVSFGRSLTPTVVASGGPLLVDVERGRGRTLFGLAQGTWPLGGPDGSPALPDTGLLLRAEADGSFSVVMAGLDRPTSMEIIRNTAYVVTLDGEVWRVEDISSPPYGVAS